jgi:hypothetical protein
MAMKEVNPTKRPTAREAHEMLDKLVGSLSDSERLEAVKLREEDSRRRPRSDGWLKKLMRRLYSITDSWLRKIGHGLRL